MQRKPSRFDKLAKKLAKKKGVQNPRAVAAAVGRRKLGQAEMTRRSLKGRRGR